jgi:uncharacterized membrane protein
MITKNKRLIGIVLTVTLLLLIPVIATGLMCELVLRTVKKFEYRVAICAAILAALVLVWIELAVGLFGTPFAGS